MVKTPLTSLNQKGRLQTVKTLLMSSNRKRNLHMVKTQTTSLNHKYGKKSNNEFKS